MLAPTPVDTGVEPLTPHKLAEAFRGEGNRLELYPDYDEEFLEWLFAELARVPRRGRLVAHLVRDEAARTLGWYIYYLRPGWRSEVLQVAAAIVRSAASWTTSSGTRIRTARLRYEGDWSLTSSRRLRGDRACYGTGEACSSTPAPPSS